MTHKTLVIDLDRCIGCFACEMACKQENNVPLGVHYNKVLSIGPMGKFPDLTQYFLPTVCQHCKDAPCVKVCPTKATYRTEDGQILVDKEKCIGCHLCEKACPRGMMTFDVEEKKASKCFLCDGEPKCVKHCPAAAIRYVPWMDRTGDEPRQSIHGYLPQENRDQCSICHR